MVKKQKANRKSSHERGKACQGKNDRLSTSDDDRHSLIFSTRRTLKSCMYRRIGPDGRCSISRSNGDMVLNIIRFAGREGLGQAE